MPQFSIHDAETKLATLLERAAAGEEIVIADGARLARIVPLAPAAAPQERVFGRLQGRVDLDHLFTPEMDAEVLRLFDEAAAKPFDR